VRAANGRVNLSGWIGDVQDDATARQIASTVPGVRRVTSNFHSWSTDSDMPMLPTAAGPSSVSSTPAPSIIGATPADRALATEVRNTLISAGAFRDINTNVVVRANKGRVNLSGWISFASNAAKVRNMASRVTGVRAVTSNFHSWSSETDPRL
jgi:osmotically-inducible protein OsmY